MKICNTWWYTHTHVSPTIKVVSGLRLCFLAKTSNMRREGLPATWALRSDATSIVLTKTPLAVLRKT